MVSLKIVVVTDNPMLYGETMYLGELKKGMEERGTEMDIVIVQAPYWLPFDGKIPLYRLLRASFLIDKLHDYDLIHVQFTFPLGFVLALLQNIHKKPVIIHTHGDDVFVVPSAGIGVRRIAAGRSLAKISWYAASHIIAVCKKAKKEIADEGIPESKISVLYNGVDENLFRRRKSIKNGKLAEIRENSDLIFLNVANLGRVKNQDRLLVAFSRLLREDKLYSNTKLIICGTGHLENELRALAHALDIESNVMLLGKIPHSMMPELYSIADAFILPSLHEAHPWSLLEAMSCELPVAASNVGGIPETLPDKEQLLNPWKTSDIYRAMASLARDTKRRKYLGSRNRKIILEKFTFGKHVRNLSSIYDKILLKSKCASP